MEELYSFLTTLCGYINVFGCADRGGDHRRSSCTTGRWRLTCLIGKVLELGRNIVFLNRGLIGLSMEFELLVVAQRARARDLLMGLRTRIRRGANKQVGQ